MILVYGGSFNPPTLAHFHIAKELIEKYQPSFFLVVPVGTVYGKPELIAFEHRAKMCELMCTRLERAMVSDIENHKTYLGTYHALKEIQQQYQEEVYFILGADNLAYLEQWKNAKALVREFQFIVITRGEYPLEQFIEEKFSNEKNNFHIHQFHDERSSSMIRKQHLFDETMVLSEVKEYIYNHQLYKE